MSNRIGQYYGSTLSDVCRAQQTISFCVAILRLSTYNAALESWEIDSLCRLQGEAVGVFRDFGIPLPWEGDKT